MTKITFRRAQLAIVLAVFAVGPLAAQSRVRAVPVPIEAVEAIGFTVSDLDRSIAFFSEALDFETVSDVEVSGDAFDRLVGVFGTRARIVRMRLGSETIELTEFLAPVGRPAPESAQSNDQAFQHIAIVVSDMERAYAKLRRHKARHVSPGPQRLPEWNPNAGGISAFYFRDPDGHALEVIQYPPGKGDPRWQQSEGRLFLGIDHTAIVVRDTERSLAFYRDLLGMQVAGESENYGPEQERLNAVFGAHLRITALRTTGGPGIEFLEYLTPREGRPFPVGERANDLIHWQTTVTAADAEAAARGLLRERATLVSPGAVRVDHATLGFSRGLLVRDPDGHVLQLVER